MEDHERESRHPDAGRRQGGHAGREANGVSRDRRGHQAHVHVRLDDAGRFSTGLHVHRVQEETFYVLEGECEWQIGDERIRATPGTFVFIPPGVPHNIANASDKPARVIMTVSPPGHEHYFEELAEAVHATPRRTRMRSGRCDAVTTPISSPR